MRYVYPCIIRKCAEDGIYYVSFPDLDDCFTDGDTFEDAVVSAKEVLEGCAFMYIKLGRKLPKPTRGFIHTKENEAVVYVDVWTAPIEDRVKNLSVKKNLTIPKWLNDEAERYGVNFSMILQSALKEYLNIS